MADTKKLPLLHYLEARKTSKHTEESKKLLASVDEITGNAIKRDETQVTKLGQMVRKVADSPFTPTFIQKFLRKSDKEGDDLATRLERTQNSLIGSITGVFKNREARDAERFGIEVSELRKFRERGFSEEDIKNQTDKRNAKRLEELLEETKERNTKSFDNMAQELELNTSALETFSKEDQDLLKQNINLHGAVKDILQNTELQHHKAVDALQKIVNASHEKGSLFVHDINTQEQLDQLNKFNEIEIEMAKDKMRKDDLAALQAKENQRQLLNATKRGAAGMGAAGRAGADDGGLLSSENILKAAGAKQLLGGGLGGLFKGGKGGMIKGVGGAVSAGKVVGIGATTIGAGAIAGAIGLLALTALQIKKSHEFAKNMSDEDKKKFVQNFGLKAFGLTEAEKLEFTKEHQGKQKEFIESQTKKLDVQTNVLLEEIKKGKEGGATPTIVNTVQDNKSIKHETNPIYNPTVTDPMRVLFRSGING